MYIHLHTCTYTYAHVHTPTHMYIHLHKCTTYTNVHTPIHVHTPTQPTHMYTHLRGGSRILGKGGLINIFTTGGGYGRGRAPSRDSKGIWRSADSSPSRVWGEAPAAFLLLHLFSMKFTVISNTNIMRLL